MSQGRWDSSPLARTSTGIGGFFAAYVWIIAKNIVGWVLIAMAVAVSPWFPGPLGMVFFLMGFALVSIPGKRRLTSRLLRGIPYSTGATGVRLTIASLAVVLPPLVVWHFSRQARSPISVTALGHGRTIALYVLAIASTWYGLVWLLRLANVGIVHWLPRVRRKVRPWLRHKGINLLPPRRTRRPRLGQQSTNEEILKIGLGATSGLRRSLRRLGRLLAPWR